MNTQIPSPATRASLSSVTTQARSSVDMLLLCCMLLLVLLLRVPALSLPLERDEGAYAYVAFRWMAGDLPYRDAFDHKPPLIYLLYMPPLLLARLSEISPPLAIRLWSSFLFVLSAWLVFLIGRRVWQRPSPIIATLLFVVSGSAFDLQGMVFNTDQALVLPALLALWFTMRLAEDGQWRWSIAAGAALAVTVLIKPVAVVLLPLILLASSLKLRALVRIGLGAALGGLLVALPLLAYFWIRNGLSDLVFGVYTYNRLYAVEARTGWSFGALVDMFTPFVAPLLVSIGGFALLTTKATSSVLVSHRAGWLVAAWTGALLVAAVGSLRAFVHYYYPTLPFLALLAAPNIVWLWNHVEGKTNIERFAGKVAPVLLAALLILPFAWQNIRLIGASPLQQAERLYGDAGRHFFAPAVDVAGFVRNHTAPDDYIYVFAAEPQIYLLANRQAASRYIYDYPLTLVPTAAAELREELRANPPSLFITYSGMHPNMFSDDPRFQNVAFLTRIGGFDLFRPQ